MPLRNMFIYSTDFIVIKMLWIIPSLLLAGGASAHTAAFVKGMYCEVRFTIILQTFNY